MVYTPGDNEWTDCWQDRAGRFDPLERLALLRARFFAGPTSLGRRPMPLLRQAAPTVENARWMQDGMLFVTLHVPGSNNGRPAKPGPPGARAAAGRGGDGGVHRARRGEPRLAGRSLAAEPAARGARDFDPGRPVFRQVCGQGYDSGYRGIRAALARTAAGFGKPVLLVNGDSHRFVTTNRWRPRRTSPG